MHWSEKVARDIIKKKPDKEEYVVAAGISPSGSVHIGNFRDIATSYFVALSLRKLGKNVRFLFSWDEYDRFRKVPINISKIAPDYEKYLGMPYAMIPDPYGCCESFAKHFEKEFEESVKKFGIELDYHYQQKEYSSGRYKEHIITALKKRLEIYDIIMDFKTQDATEEEKENYYPVSIYCKHCGKDNTKIISLSEDCTVAKYKCKCGHEDTFDFTKDTNCKLVWKVDWPMRWMVEGVDFEPGGKDHAAIGGSYQVSSVIAKKIYGYEAPMFQGYEFIGIKGTTGKMSSSSGLNMVPNTLLTVYQPELILWLYAKTEPTKAFDFCFDDEILRQYFEFDKMLNSYRKGDGGDYVNDIMEKVLIKGREVVTVPIAQLVSFGPIVNWNEKMLENLFRKIGLDYTADEFRERLNLAKYWLIYCSPENLISLNKEKNTEYYNTISNEEKQMIKLLYEGLRDNDYSLDELNVFLYSIAEKVYGAMDDKTKKAYQTKFFEIVYMLLIGKAKGPRLYLFLKAVDKNSYVELLNFAS